MRQYILLVILMMVAPFYEVIAQTRDSLAIKNQIERESNLIHFRFAMSIIDSGYMDNSASLQELDRILTDKNRILNIDSMVIIASASPEGVVKYNQTLATRRANAVKRYILWKYPFLNQHPIYTYSVGENWEGLRQLVEADGNAPYKEQILKIIASDINPSSKEWRLKQIGQGRAWSYITNHYLRHLRTGATCVVFYEKQEIEKPVEQPLEKIITEKIEILIPFKPLEQRPVISQHIEPKQRKPLLALKTNLLFDAVSALNIAVEVPIGKRWSVGGEWMFPWWQSGKSNFTMQLLAGHGEVKYWLGSRTKYEVMTGWSLGLYGGGGKYDFQIFNNNGSQGNFFDVGVSVGYAHKISRSFRMEYSLGLGYLRTDYESYHQVRNTQYGDIKVVNYPWEIHRLDWFGPTQAKISLVWMLNHEKKGTAK